MLQKHKLERGSTAGGRQLPKDALDHGNKMTPPTTAPQGTGSSSGAASAPAPAATGQQQQQGRVSSFAAAPSAQELASAIKDEVEKTALKIDLIAAVREKLEGNYKVDLPLDFGTICMTYNELEIRHASDMMQKDQHQIDKNNCMGRPS